MKEQIIATALNLFLSKGVMQTSLIDIAKEINLTKGAIYHYFKNKNELIFESFDLISAGLESFLLPISNDDVSLRDTFDILTSIMIEQSNVDATGQYEFLLYCSRKYPELRVKLIGSTEKFNGVIKEKIKQGMNNNIIRKDIDLDYIMLKISLVFEGTMYLDQVYTPINLKQYVPMMFDEIIRDISFQ